MNKKQRNFLKEYKQICDTKDVAIIEEVNKEINIIHSQFNNGLIKDDERIQRMEDLFRKHGVIND